MIRRGAKQAAFLHFGARTVAGVYLGARPVWGSSNALLAAKGARLLAARGAFLSWKTGR